ncbi:MarR family transcriptional regulator [Hyphobacterium sp. HN65]|uniref:MarR family transcriptional regulator n=1 Tax=Hyphobacterium lacteum TaxID=3116575 RepID=A0ABU7LR06_9PROT|nr:MarR family transcriptional regulator [Hyphobacterium sp. HN65]MEE2526347.1 MarR family transcriptional regulator [Hyphobacterium sp. HN65]
MPESESLFDTYAPAFFARRASMLVDKIISQGGASMQAFGLKSPVPAISTLLVLRKAELSVTEIATHLGVTHAAIIKNVRLLEREGLVERISDDRDARRKPLRLTAGGQEESVRTAAFLAAAQTAYRQIFEEIGVDMDAAIVRMEAALERQSFDLRLREAAEKVP